VKRLVQALLTTMALGLAANAGCVQVTCPNGMYVVRDIVGVPTHHCIVPTPTPSPAGRET
jgi:hypothetical protein